MGISSQRACFVTVGSSLTAPPRLLAGRYTYIRFEKKALEFFETLTNISCLALLAFHLLGPQPIHLRKQKQSNQKKRSHSRWCSGSGMEGHLSPNHRGGATVSFMSLADGSSSQVDLTHHTTARPRWLSLSWLFGTAYIANIYLNINIFLKNKINL